MNYKWLTALSIIGFFLGIALFLYEATFSLWGCFGPYACPPPFSYYFYGFYLPFGIMGASFITLSLSLAKQGTPRKERVFITAVFLLILALVGFIASPSLNL